MKIMVINPNTTESMTEHLRRTLMPLKGESTELAVVNPEHGPVSIVVWNSTKPWRSRRRSSWPGKPSGTAMTPS